MTAHCAFIDIVRNDSARAQPLGPVAVESTAPESVVFVADPRRGHAPCWPWDDHSDGEAPNGANVSDSAL